LKYQIEVLRVPYGLETWSLRRGWNDKIRTEAEEYQGVSFSPKEGVKHKRLEDCTTVIRFLALKGFLQRGYMRPENQILAEVSDELDGKTVLDEVATSTDNNSEDSTTVMSAASTSSSSSTSKSHRSSTSNKRSKMRRPVYFAQFESAVGQMRGVLSEFLWFLARDYIMDNGLTMSYCARKEMIVTFKTVARAWRGWWPKRNVIMPITGTLTHLMRNPKSVYALDFDIDVGLCQMRLPQDNEGELRWRGQLASAQFCKMHLAKL
ncbi:unnamed protein product, partial [Amoebophrya sp. A120]